MQPCDEIIRLVNINKQFPGVFAAKNVSFSISKSEVVGLCGENGAGKSTLMKIMSGVYQPDSGYLYYQGEKVVFKTPADSLSAGISIIHQELSYFDDLSVAENIFMNRLPICKGIIDWKQLYYQTEQLFRKYNINVNPKDIMSKLPIASKQLVEIAKAISRTANVVILDEPTSSLGLEDVDKLMRIIAQTVSEGVSFILISHRLNELIKICDRIIVMRDGEKINEFDKKEFNQHTIICNMIGHEISEQYFRENTAKGNVVLEVDSLCSDFLKNVSLRVRGGEIVGLYGMAGSGQDEIMESIFGIRCNWTGTIKIDNIPFHAKNPEVAIKNAIAYVTAERRQDGLILEDRTDNNIVLASLKSISEKGVIKYKTQKSLASKWIQNLSIKVASQSVLVGNLSGGNQQKVVIAKWLETKPKLLLLNEPMRGVDVGVKREIFQILQELCRQGVAILMISSDMMEMLDITDCIYTLSNGEITNRFTKEEATQEKLLLASIGRLEV